MPEWIQAIAKMAEGRVTRSTAMQPILWMIAVCLVALTGSVAAHAPMWLLIVLVSIAGLVIVVAVVVFCVFAARSPDLLRSEKYLIRRMELEQSSIGDNIRGVIAPEKNTPQLPNATDGGVH
jgi:hypothetical protein